MDIKEAIELIGDIRRAEKNPNTPVGAAKALQKHLGVLVTIGPLIDGKFALYANAYSNEIPSEWNGFIVVGVKDRTENENN